MSKVKSSSPAAQAARGASTLSGRAGKLGSAHGKTMKQFSSTSGMSMGGRTGKLPAAKKGS